jgi:hypothetical protein
LSERVFEWLHEYAHRKLAEAREIRVVAAVAGG